MIKVYDSDERLFNNNGISPTVCILEVIKGGS